MAFEVAHYEKFPYELSDVPKKVRNACYRWQTNVKNQEILPNRSDPPTIKKLNEYRNLWRLRIGDDYRMIYSVNSNRQLVTMLMIGHRKKIYDRIDADEAGKPGVRITAYGPELLEKLPTADEVNAAKKTLASRVAEDASISTDKKLPVMLNSELLDRWGIPEEYHNLLENVYTEDDLLCIDDIPEGIIAKIMDLLWPPNAEEVVQKPVRVAMHPSEIEEAADGKRKLESFLLMLDEEQEEFVARFKGDSRPVGPWLLKGGPGSGKSTVTLYSIRSLLEGLTQLNLFEQDGPLNILYTTFTNSLVRVSEHLLDTLGLNKSKHKLEVRTVDSLAMKYQPEEYSKLTVCYGREDLENRVCNAIDICEEKTRRFSFSYEDKKFLLEEIDWVIVGQDLKSVEEYLDVDRSGRGRALGQQQRQHLWLLYEILHDLLRENGECLFSERLRAAAQSATPHYDYIFIDEAQDLKPVAIRFLMGLCQNRKNIFLTADINQSIWGYSFSWTKMASDLQVRGRARILRRNYRTTKEIWSAVLQVAPDSDSVDKETLSTEAVYLGARPILSHYSKLKQAEERLNAYLFEALRLERATPASAAVLCPTNKEAKNVYEMLDQKLKPKIMKSKEVDISWPGIKILTMHAAKGLEFPVVAVFSLEKGRLPWPARDGIDEEEHIAQQQRLLFVACSRAMRRLIVFAHQERPSPFVDYFSSDLWDFEEL